MTQNKEHHLSEWAEESGVASEIVKLNVRSLDDPREIDELLDRNTKNKWQHWQHGPGWAVVGVDPESGMPTWEGTQFKPDSPVHRYVDGVPKFKRDGSPDYQKYFSASNCETVPLFLDTGKPDYWLEVMSNVTRRLLITEGAKKAGAALTVGEACVSLPGVSNGQRKGRLKKSLEKFCQVGRTVVLCFDSDLYHNPNVCKALDKLGRLLSSRGVVVQVLMLPRTTKGLDDFIVAYGAEAFRKLLDEALTLEEWREEYILHPIKEVKTTTPESPDAEENYQLKAQAALFSDTRWVSIDGQLYHWTGTHYRLVNTAALKKKISDWCRATPVFIGEDWKYAYATATHVENIYAWVVTCFSVDPGTVNPPGLNCLNGVLKISWTGTQPHWKLAAHDPAVIYTYVGEFEYNPAADKTACDLLLSCLDRSHQKIFLKTLAASLDLRTIRRFRGRGIRALLCKGDGNNGKDSLREAVNLLYGVGVVSCTVSDFQAYDQGRKFTLAKLEQARISWSSENSSFGQLDSLQSLKAAITGETLDLERKNVDERAMEPCTVFFFNINNAPNLQASLEAIQSRWAVLSFNRTFKVNADPSRGEIEADPRFRYDPNFLRNEVVPALLNQMLAVLPEVAMTAIDYDCTEKALQEIQEQTNHLWSFVREVGLGYCPNGRVYIGDLWEMLKQWYINNGTLVVTTDGKKEKHEWNDQSQRGDKNIKGPNQIYQRFSELFPKVRKERDNSTLHKRGQFYLAGLGLGVSNETTETTKPSSQGKSVVDQVLDLFNGLSPEEQREIREKLVAGGNEMEKQLRIATHVETDTGSLTPSDASHTPSVSDSPVTSTGSLSSSIMSNSVTGNAGNNTVSTTTKNFRSGTGVFDFKEGDRVVIDCPGLKAHGKVGEIMRLKEGEQGIKLADVQLPDTQRCIEVQLAWLHSVPLEGEQQALPID